MLVGGGTVAGPLAGDPTAGRCAGTGCREDILAGICRRWGSRLRGDDAQGELSGNAFLVGGGLDGVGTGDQGFGDAGVGVSGLHVVIVGHHRSVGIGAAQQVQVGVLGGGQVDLHFGLLVECE